jgi:hypothetical protein
LIWIQLYILIESSSAPLFSHNLNTKIYFISHTLIVKLIFYIILFVLTFFFTTLFDSLSKFAIYYIRTAYTDVILLKQREIKKRKEVLVSVSALYYNIYFVFFVVLFSGSKHILFKYPAFRIVIKIVKVLNLTI